MPRQARKDLSYNFVHIMAQGINKEYIFESKHFKKKYWDILCEKKRDYDIDIISHCIMDNHVHLVAYYNKVEELSIFMKRTNTAYAKWYNEQKDRVGYVFRDRYKTEQITDAHHLYSCINYVHNNPVKAKIVKRPELYKFSSYLNYLSDDYILKSKIFIILNISLQDFKEIFINSIDSDFYSFREKAPEKIIEEYLKEKNIQSFKDIITKKEKKELILLLKEKSNLKYDEIAKMLGISRTSIYRLKEE